MIECLRKTTSQRANRVGECCIRLVFLVWVTAATTLVITCVTVPGACAGVVHVSTTRINARFEPHMSLELDSGLDPTCVVSVTPPLNEDEIETSWFSSWISHSSLNHSDGSWRHIKCRDDSDFRHGISYSMIQTGDHPDCTTAYVVQSSASASSHRYSCSAWNTTIIPTGGDTWVVTPGEQANQTHRAVLWRRGDPPVVVAFQWWKGFNVTVWLLPVNTRDCEPVSQSLLSRQVSESECAIGLSAGVPKFYWIWSAPPVFISRRASSLLWFLVYAVFIVCIIRGWLVQRPGATALIFVSLVMFHSPLGYTTWFKWYLTATCVALFIPMAHLLYLLTALLIAPDDIYTLPSPKTIHFMKLTWLIVALHACMLVLVTSG